jgi:hypothetical protein
MTIGMSRHAFWKVVWRSSQQTWCELHEEAIAYFGAAPKSRRTPERDGARFGFSRAVTPAIAVLRP